MVLIYGLWTAVAALIAMSSAVLFGVLIATPLMLVPRGRRERYGVWAAVLFGHTTLRLGFLARPRVSGLENLPPESGYLVISNHRSWVDPVTHCAYARASGLAKQEIYWLPFIGYYAYAAGAVFFDRSSRAGRRRAFHEVMMLLNGGGNIYVFPEGTRSRDGKIREKVHLKLVEACWEDGVPVLPAAVMGTERVMPVKPPVVVPFQSYDVKYLPLVKPEDYPDAEAFAAAAWGRVVEAVADFERNEEMSA